MRSIRGPMQMYKTYPTRRAVLQRIVGEYDLLQRFWREGFLERGHGVLVLHQMHTAADDLRSVSEFWTLAEIRSLLREMGYFDEFIYAWLLSVTERDALPALVIGMEPGDNKTKLSFYRIHRPIVEKSRKNS